MQLQYQFNQRDLGHGAAESILHPVVMVALLVTIVLMLWRPRKYLVIPLLLCTFLVPRGQVIVLAGAHFYVRLVLVLVGFVRVVMARFRIAGGLNGIDKLFIAWAAYRVMAATITNWPDGLMENLAFLLQALCGYFLFRYLLQDEEDIARAAKTLAIIAVILGAGMAYEYTIHVNLFGTYLGGAPVAPLIRNGAGRAQATFGHSILAGCFGATVFPLFVWLWKKKSRILAVAGILGSAAMVLTTTSSTPMLALVAGVFGLLLWPIRTSMRLVRWSIVAFVVGLAIVMDAPVWYVISHINVVGGSGGYDRAFLIDTCMRHIKDWWLIGTNQNGNWGYDMWDLSDQFVAEAEVGGLFSLVCFIAIIARSFGRLGSMRKRAEPEQRWLFWCLGSIMLAQIFAYFGVSYWDQTQIWWFAFLAMISAATIPLDRPQEETVAAAPSTKVEFANFGRAVRPWGSR